MKRIAIIDASGWTSWPDKITSLRLFWNPITEILCDVFPYRGDILFDSGNDILPGSFYPLLVWYKDIAEKIAPDFDEYLLIVPPAKWGNQSAQGFIQESKYMSISVNEYDNIYFKEPTGKIPAFFWFASHEISHNLCQDFGATDSTHIYFDLQNPNHFGIIEYLREKLKTRSEAWYLIIKSLREIIRLLGLLIKQKQIEVWEKAKLPDPPPPPPPPPPPETIQDMVRRICKEEELTPEMSERLFKTIKCESDFNPKAIHKNTNGTTDYGIIQANDKWYIGPGKPIPNIDTALNNPQFCVRVMARAFKQGNARHWVCYKRLYG